MYQQLYLVLPHVLKIIQYPENEQQFIQTFLQQCRQLTTLQLIQDLPHDKQDELKKRLAVVASGEVGKEIIFSYFSKQNYEQILDFVAEKYFQEYIADILPKLSPGKKNELKIYLNQLSKNS